MTVAIIDYGSGNLRSAAKAFERAVAENDLDEKIVVTSKADEVLAANRIVLPGVGDFGDCKRGLEAVPDMVETLHKTVFEQKKPFLGICVGMQLLASKGFEHGEHEGLDWIKGNVVALEPADKTLKVPHMGWNEITVKNTMHPVLKDIDTGSHAYFVHSFHFECNEEKDVIATVDYGQPLTAITGHENIIGTQFHPEKSQKTGLTFIANFLNWKP